MFFYASLLHADFLSKKKIVAIGNMSHVLLYGQINVINFILNTNMCPDTFKGGMSSGCQGRVVDYSGMKVFS